MSQSGLNMSRRIRRTPYTDRVEAHGVRGFSVVNHMLLPKHLKLVLRKITGILKSTFKFGMFLVKGKSKLLVQMLQN